MSVSEARRKANDKWLKEKTEDITLRVPKGKKERIKALAVKKGKSTNGFINELIDAALELDNEQSLDVKK